MTREEQQTIRDFMDHAKSRYELIADTATKCSNKKMAREAMEKFHLIDRLWLGIFTRIRITEE